MEKIYTIGRFDEYSDGSFRLEEKFTTGSPYWKVVDGKIYYVHWDVVNKQYIERAITEMNMSKEEALAKDCHCYYQILETTNGRYMCMNTYENEVEEYGTDFLCGRCYDYKDGYMHSTENGTDVMIPEEELRKYWTLVG